MFNFSASEINPAWVGRSDEDLVNAMRDGQLEALRVLYRRYSRLIYTLAYRILQNPEEAEEITQDVFLTLWHRDTYRPERGSLSRFLVVMTRSRSIDRLRSHQTHHQRIQKWQAFATTDTTNSPLDFAHHNERADSIRQALDTLNPTEREVLEIAYYEGLSQSEIAQRLDIPLGTVKTRSRQALRKLRQTLENHV
jgi:RNA polymerase sigma-70 factor, ECF subfamily